MTTKNTAALQQLTPTLKSQQVEKVYKAARERYGELDVDTDKAIDTALAIPLSMHCWQADDVAGLETPAEGALDGGGIQATGNYPGAARNGDEIRQDFDKAAGFIPGTLRCNLHAMYAETDGKAVDRDEIQPEHFSRWMDWGKERGYGLDFNPTCFAHPKVKNGLTLSSEDRKIRQFWVDHCIACRKIGEVMARKTPGKCTINYWIPDGRKDSTVDRSGPRERLVQSLDAVFADEAKGVVDAVESKLFGIGCEDYTVGSNEFYLAYAATRKTALCFDMGHFHPTESVADKISAAMPFIDQVLLHASRGVRWDSDHVTLSNDDIQALCNHAVQGGYLKRIIWALDFFDASINRIGAWAVGVRSLRKALLRALLTPWKELTALEYAGKGAAKLALLERMNELPFGPVWDYACDKAGVAPGSAWLRELEEYEQNVQLPRS